MKVDKKASATVELKVVVKVLLKALLTVAMKVELMVIVWEGQLVVAKAD